MNLLPEHLEKFPEGIKVDDMIDAVRFTIRSETTYRDLMNRIQDIIKLSENPQKMMNLKRHVIAIRVAQLQDDMDKECECLTELLDLSPKSFVMIVGLGTTLLDLNGSLQRSEENMSEGNYLRLLHISKRFMQ